MEDRDFILRVEHEEFARRMAAENQRLEDENNRQNHRLELLEQSVREFGSLASSVERLATNMESMCRVQEQQGQRLSELEGRDGAKWRSVVGYVGTAVLGILLGALARQFGL